MRALLFFGVHICAPDCWKLTYRFEAYLRYVIQQLEDGTVLLAPTVTAHMLRLTSPGISDSCGVLKGRLSGEPNKRDAWDYSGGWRESQVTHLIGFFSHIDSITQANLPKRDLNQKMLATCQFSWSLHREDSICPWCKGSAGERDVGPPDRLTASVWV